MSYDFSVNPAKLARAMLAVKARSEKPTEENVKAEYIKLGGKLTDVKVEPTVAPKIEDTVQVDKQPVVVSEVAKKKTKKSAI